MLGGIKNNYGHWSWDKLEVELFETRIKKILDQNLLAKNFLRTYKYISLLIHTMNNCVAKRLNLVRTQI